MTLEQKTAEAEVKASELSTLLNTKVHPFIFKGNKGDDDFVVGFIKEPNRIIKARAIDKILQGSAFSVGIEIVEACLIKEDSDPRIVSELPENDNFALGAAKFAGDLIKYSIDQTKKK